MSLVLVVLVAALAIGWARGGSLDRLGWLPLRSRRLVVAALAAQLLGTVVGGPFHPLGLIASAALVVAFLARNRGIRGTGLVAVGLAANALVVGANGAMPVSAEAAGRAGVGVQDLLTGADARHEPVGPGTRLRPLADVIPLPLPLRPEVVSPGDVLLAAGLGQLVTLGMVGAGATGSAAGRVAGRPGSRVEARGTDRTTARRRGRRGPVRRPLPPLPPTSARPSPGSRRALPPRRPARPDGES